MEELLKVLKVTEDMNAIYLEFLTDSKVRLGQPININIDEKRYVRMPIVKMESDCNLIKVTAEVRGNNSEIDDIRELITKPVTLM